MFVMSIALGGCIKGPPVEFGLTEDTGGHITYLLGAASALAERRDVDRVEIATRLIDEPKLGAAYAVPLETVSPKLAIRRIDSGNRHYLCKEANAADRPAFRDALLRHLAEVPRLPDVFHAHFADAGDVALAVRDRFGIPFIYTAHSLAIDKLTASDGSCGLAARIAEEDRIIAAADAIVASSRDEAERQLMLYPSACPSRIHRIAPGAVLASGGRPDVARARSLIAPFLRDPAKPIVLAIARPVAKKNLAGLIDLFAGDPTLRDRANLVVLAGLRDGPGSGEDEQRAVIGSLLDRLDRHNLYGSLALPKRHDQDDVRALYALTRLTRGVFVNPAFTEPYGLTLTEAAAHGLPVVATCHGGAADIVAAIGHGRVADPRDPAAFAEAIGALIGGGGAWRRASRHARANSAAMSWDGYAERFVRVVRQVAVPASRTEVAGPNRLLLCDIDNTLTGCRAGARDFRRFVSDDSGLAFGVATGRSLQEAVRLLDEWECPDPRVLVTSVGSEIYWREGARLIPDHDFAAAIALEWDPAEVERRLRSIAGLVPQPPVEQRRFKRSYFVADAATAGAARAALASLPVRVVHSHGNLLDVLPGGAGKGAAMAWAARRLGVPRQRVFAAGDSGNDLDMLARCRNPILVANHSDELKPLLRSPAIYLARRPHAGGIVEGMRALVARAAA